MASINLKVPLTSEESQFFNSKFKELDTDSLGVLTGENSRSLFANSGLSSHILSQIWALVDINNKGFLNFNEFSAALRCIGMLQTYSNLPINNTLYENPLQKMPNLQGSSITNMTINDSSLSIPLPSSSDIIKFAELFDRTAGIGNNILTGDKAKDIFLKARLPNQTLGEIWGLCDKNASGSLEKPEFIMAMYLIQLSMTGNPSMNVIPTNLPQSLWTAVSNIPQQQSFSNNMTMPGTLSTNSTGTSTTLGRQPTISRVSSGAFNNASNDWVLTPEKKQQFDAIFNSLDKQHIGKLGSQVLVPFFLSSKLNQETLATVWDLADIHNNAEFSNMEFSIAMFLIQKKNAGIDLPDVVPNELLQSPALGLYPQQQQQQQPSMTIPSRATKPSFQDMPQQQAAPQQIPQNSNNGSLNDLMALNNTFSPSPQPIVRNDTNNSMNSGNHPTAQHSAMNLKKFNPTSQFGQHIIQEEEESNNFVAPQQQQKQAVPAVSSAPVAPMQRAASVSLPQVPNFGSLNLASTAIGAGVGAAVGGATASAFHNNDLYADSNASAQLSAATTDMANLSNQMNSLSKQATITNDKKAKASQELARVTDMKNSLNVKLTTLRNTHEQNVKQTEDLQRSLAVVNGENDQLKQQLAVVEANYHAIETKLNESNEEFQRAQEENNNFKEQIKNLNIQSSTLQVQLDEKQQQVKQQRSMVDVNSKQLELSQITVANFTSEISGLEEKLASYLTKKQELEDYEKTIQGKHSELETRFNELTDKETDLNQRDVQLKDHTQQIEEQEKIYNDQVVRLQAMFTDLSQRKESFDKADQELKAQNMEYASKVQDLAERQMNLAMGEMPEDAKDIIEKNKMNKQVETPVSLEDEETSRTERSGSEVFDKDVPTLASQSEQGEPQGAPDANQPLSDRFEGDLNEYGIPRTESLTSSVANNAPQSVRGDAEIVEALDSRISETPALPSAGTVTGEQAKDVSIPQKDNDTDKDSNLSGAESENSIQHSLVAEDVDKHFEEAVDHVNVPGGVTANAIDEEFPPIRELEIEESDSSDEDDENEHFEDTKDVITPSMQNVSKQATEPKDEFDDEFAGLEQADVEENDSDNENSGVAYTAADAMEPFEDANQTDLRDQLHSNDFTASESAVPQQQEQTNVSNDEWDEIFAGFGNGKQPANQTQGQLQQPIHNALQQPTPDRNSMPPSNSKVDRMIATTPKALAIEELSGMGFSEAEATKALEKCNWDLDTATNYLLDNA
ncbi:similar to Saccharomyces cerevisiae YBL047C EDE1 Key endocytic protein involved in a network of interactions with other endocytic proteins [Maudiozyma saulgeensis]|uniref:Similar to Saccharomyces cerevisiae YBL047C EDE1 Key endocytic protein involved in a network of interactions with other endocytic proteins n=1 Tax=Maudiozyma saulgeensis TaxID=1789683 RepID=A0A1X7R5V2_9SACH|nr:similar to Saccharomyces cerevisiae YBL047C EDE1 Key endocytic protein involved in a network of interactions with other endocytic proteins [Kazachstania saulgeensis]